MLRKNIVLLLILSLFACSKGSSVVAPVKPVTPVTEADPAQYGIPFSGVPDREDATIYQVNMREFGSQGNFAGVIARMDSIKAL